MDGTPISLHSQNSPKLIILPSLRCIVRVGLSWHGSVLSGEAVLGTVL